MGKIVVADRLKPQAQISSDEASAFAVGEQYVAAARTTGFRPGQSAHESFARRTIRFDLDGNGNPA